MCSHSELNPSAYAIFERHAGFIDLERVGALRVLVVGGEQAWILRMLELMLMLGFARDGGTIEVASDSSLERELSILDHSTALPSDAVSLLSCEGVIARKRSYDVVFCLSENEKFVNTVKDLRSKLHVYGCTGACSIAWGEHPMSFTSSVRSVFKPVLYALLAAVMVNQALIRLGCYRGVPFNRAYLLLKLLLPIRYEYLQREDVSFRAYLLNRIYPVNLRVTEDSTTGLAFLELLVPHCPDVLNVILHSLRVEAFKGGKLTELLEIRAGEKGVFSFLEGVEVVEECGRLDERGAPSLPSELSRLNVFIGGVGAIGTWISYLLSQTTIGELELSLLDMDTVEYHNLNRQVLFKVDDVGLPKVEAVKRALLSLKDLGLISSRALNISSIERELDSTVVYGCEDSEISSVLEEADIVVACFDNGRSRALLNRLSLRYGKAYVYSGCELPLVQVLLIPPEKGCVLCWLGNKVEEDTTRVSCIWGDIPLASSPLLSVTAAALASLSLIAYKAGLEHLHAAWHHLYRNEFSKCPHRSVECPIHRVKEECRMHEGGIV